MVCASGFNGRSALRMHKQAGAWEEKAGQSWFWPMLRVGNSLPRDRIPCSEPSHPKAWRAEKSRVVGSVARGGADERERSLAQHQQSVASRQDPTCNTDCRDTCATTLLDAAVPLDRVQLILGYGDIGMTRRYAETRPEALREAIAATFDR